MVKYMNYLLLVFLVLCCIGCAPTPHPPIEIKKVNFTKTEPITQAPITKPDKPKYILLDENFESTLDVAKVKYFAFTATEFAKIIALSTSFDAQVDMFEQSIELTNLKIAEINALKELIATKEVLSEHLAVLYANEQNIRQLESRDYKLEKFMDRIYMVIQSGVIVALAIVAL